MAPQGFTKHANAFEADIFSLPVHNAKKRKSKKLNPNAPVFKRKKEKHTGFVPQQPKSELQVITIDSDDEVQVLKPEDVTDSDNDSVKICEPTKEIIELNDSETDDNNLIININQTENVDKIVDSALGRLTNKSNADEDGINVVAKEKELKQVRRAQVHKYPKSWTREMIRFYTEPCDDKRNFDYEKILNNLKSMFAQSSRNIVDIFKII